MIIFLLASIISLICINLWHNYRAVPISIPGPFLARFTDLWRAWTQRQGTLRSDLICLHAKHGPVVRYGVKSISLSSAEAIDLIYSTRAGFVTADSYKVLVGISNGKEVPSLVSTRDEVRHGQLRRAVASAFTAKGAGDYEEHINAAINDLLVYLRSHKSKFDLSDVLVLWSMDSAARQAFSEPLGCLRSGSDIDGSIQLVRDRFNHWGKWSSLPWLERLIYRNHWAMYWSKGQTPSAMVRRASEKLKSRLLGEKKESKDMLQKFIAAHDANPDVFDTQGIVSLLMSTISGAGDTTATTLTAIFSFLLKHPEELVKLREELAQSNRNEVLPLTIVDKLPYLNAVIKESMRLFPTVTWPIERIVPTCGMNVAGYDIPEGVSVGVFPSALHLDPDIFGDDVHTFRPHRWLDATDQQLKNMEHAFMGFSRGRRVCLGQKVALMQMKKVVSALVVNLDMQLVEQDAQLEADFSPAVARMKPLWVAVEPLR